MMQLNSSLLRSETMFCKTITENYALCNMKAQFDA